MRASAFAHLAAEIVGERPRRGCGDVGGRRHRGRAGISKAHGRRKTPCALRTGSIWHSPPAAGVHNLSREVAQAAQVEWLVDFEHGKPTLERAKVLRALSTLGVQVHVEMGRSPDWTLPLTAAAIDRRARVAALRPKTRVLKDRADVVPLADWPGR